MDETWNHHYTPESKQQSVQWTEAGCSTPKKTRSDPSAGKVTASVFWDAEGILFIDYLEKRKTITGEYYSSFLTRLDEKIRWKMPGLQKKKIIFHQDNVPAHKSVLAMGKLRDLHNELLKHPPYLMFCQITADEERRVSQRTVVVQHPSLVFPQFRPLPAHSVP